MIRPVLLVLLLPLAGCIAQSGGEPRMWFATHGATPPSATRVVVCHGFGCHYRDSVGLSKRDLATMRRLIAAGRASPEAERQAIARFVAHMEDRVAAAAGSAGDVGGLDMWNAGKRGQMDCIDEAANTTSYLLIAEKRGYLAHHEVRRPVARGFFLDGRYPHATAVVREKRSGTPYAVDSWRKPNGERPVVMPLAAWFEESPARFRFRGG